MKKSNCLFWSKDSQFKKDLLPGLENELFNFLEADNIEEFNYYLEYKKPEFIILREKMEEIDGLELCGEIRSTFKLLDSYILFLSNSSNDFAEITAYKLGADDFLSDQLKPRILREKLKSWKKKLLKDVEPSRIEVKDLLIDRDDYTIVYQQKDFFLNKLEFEILWLLATKPGKIYSTEFLLKRFWGEEESDKRLLVSQISNLRKKIGKNNIKSIKGIGYKLNII